MSIERVVRLAVNADSLATLKADIERAMAQEGAQVLVEREVATRMVKILDTMLEREPR